MSASSLSKKTGSNKPWSFTEQMVNQAPIVCGNLLIIWALICLESSFSQEVFLDKLYPGAVRMAFSTAALFVIFGLLLISRNKLDQSKLVQKFHLLAVGLTLYSGLASLACYYLQLNLSYMALDSFGLSLTAATGSEFVPMSPVTGAVFILCGLAWLILIFAAKDVCSKQQVSGLSGLGISLFSLLILLSYVYQAPLFYGGAMVPVAASTALGFLLSGLGLIFSAGADCLPLKPIMGDSVQARLMRIFPPIIALSSLLEPLMERLLQQSNYSGSALTDSLLALTFSAFGVALVIKLGNKIGRELDQQVTARMQAEIEARLSEARLLRLVNILQKQFSSAQEFLDFALNEAITLTDSKIGYIYHYNADLKLFTLNSWSKDVMRECSITKPQTCYELDKTGVWGEAVRQRKPIIINNFQEYHPLKKGYPQGHAHLLSYMTIPVIKDGQVIAVVGLGNKEDNYTDSDVEQLTLFINAVWQVLERKEAEELLHAKEEQLISLSDNLPDGIVYQLDSGVNGELRVFKYISAGVESMHGLTAAQVLADATLIYSQIIAEDALLLVELEASSIVSMSPFHAEVRVKLPNEELRWRYFSSAPKRLPNEHLIWDGVEIDITERKRAEAELKRALIMNEQILEHASVGIAVYEGASGKCVMANQKLATLLGTSIEGIKRQNFRELSSWKESGRFILAEKSLTEHVFLRQDTEFTSSFGKRLSLECTFATFFIDHIQYLLRVDRDISERREFENKINSQLLFVQALMDAIPIPVYYKDNDGNYLGCNKAYEELRGITKDQLRGRNIIDILGPELGKLHEEKESEIIQTGITQNYEHITVTKSGDVRNAIFHKAPFKNLKGDIEGIVCVITDITTRKQAEEALRNSEETLRNILRGIKAGIVVVDPHDFVIVDINSVAETIIGVSREEIIGKPCSNIKWIVRNGVNNTEKCPLLENNIVNEEVWIERPDGKAVPVAKTVLSAQRGHTMLLYEVIFDISERKAIELQLSVAQRLESIGSLASGIAHEINTPIQYIGDNLSFLLGAFETLRQALEQSVDLARENPNIDTEELKFILDEAPKALSQSSEGVQRVTNIVQAMKRFSHPGGEGKSFIDLSKAIENTVLVSRNEWKYHSEIKLDLDPEANNFYGFASDLNQVLLNLLVNASHAINDKYKDREDKGLITITTRRDRGFLEMSVSDTGCGIKEKNLHRIFDPFFTTKEVGKGTGQGLAITHDAVVNKHGGTIEVQSEYGQGTIFILRFPVEDTDKDIK